MTWRHRNDTEMSELDYLAGRKLMQVSYPAKRSPNSKQYGMTKHLQRWYTRFKAEYVQTASAGDALERETSTTHDFQVLFSVQACIRRGQGAGTTSWSDWFPRYMTPASS